MKRVLCMILAGLMTVSALVGCGQKEETGEAKSNTLIVGIPKQSGVSDYEENAFTNYLEEQTGAKIQFHYFSSTGSEYKQQLTLLCSSKRRLPDVIVGFNDMGHYSVNQFGEDGFFIDLRDLIEEHADNFNAQMKNLSKELREYIEEKGTNTNDGAFYALPRVTCETPDLRQSLTYINKNWLDKLGLQIPTTVSELENVLQQFKTGDPNGNGKADEIPMLLYGGGTAFIVNSYIEWEAGNFNVKDGKIWDPVVTDEFRQALIKANELVQKELYSELSYTVNLTEAKRLISPVDGPSTVGIFSGNHETMINVQSKAMEEFVALPALADSTGKGGYEITKTVKVDWSGFITKDCENTELAIKFLDAFFADEAVTRQRHGAPGIDWEYKEAENPLGTTSYVKELSETGTKQSDSSWGVNIMGIMTHFNYLAINEAVGEGRQKETLRLTGEQWDVMQAGKKRAEVVGDLIYTQEEYEVREAKASKCNNYLNEMITLFVTGEADVRDDAKWNEYLSNLKAYGRDELIEIAQKAYDRKTEGK